MNSWRIETKCLHEGYKPGNGEPRVLPIYQSTTYKYDSSEEVAMLFDRPDKGHIYSRISNPTNDALEKDRNQKLVSGRYRSIGGLRPHCSNEHMPGGDLVSSSTVTENFNLFV